MSPATSTTDSARSASGLHVSDNSQGTSQRTTPAPASASGPSSSPSTLKSTSSPSIITHEFGVLALSNSSSSSSFPGDLNDSNKSQLRVNGVGGNFNSSASNSGMNYYERSSEDRDLSPERMNLNRRNLYSCLRLSGEERLRLLNYQSNFITKIDGLDNLKNLVFLDFYNNSIEKISGLNHLQSLRVLMLGRNKIQKIENLECLTKLDVLDLHSNHITKIENISHLNELRVLNLEDNKIAYMENLPSASLTEINLKRNEITTITGAQTLHTLRRLVLGHNNITSFEPISDLLMIQPTLIELSIESNPITSDPYYRAILTNRIKSLKFLDGKRISDEERRAAARIAKREAERRRENDRVSVKSEERKRSIALIKSRWDFEMAKQSKPSASQTRDFYSSVLKDAALSSLKSTPVRPSSSSTVSNVERLSVTSNASNKFRRGADEVQYSESSNGLAFIQNSTLYIYGDALSILDKQDPVSMSNLVSVVFNYLPIEKIASNLYKIKRMSSLEKIEFAFNNIYSLKQINLLSNIKTQSPLHLVIEHNPIVFSPLFIDYVLFKTSHLNLRSLNGTELTETLKEGAKTKFANLKQILTETQLLANWNDALFPSSASMASSSVQQDSNMQSSQNVGSGVSQDAAGFYKLKSISSQYIDSLVDESVDLHLKHEFFYTSFPTQIQTHISHCLNKIPSL